MIVPLISVHIVLLHVLQLSAESILLPLEIRKKMTYPEDGARDQVTHKELEADRERKSYIFDYYLSPSVPETRFLPPSSDPNA